MEIFSHKIVVNEFSMIRKPGTYDAVRPKQKNDKPSYIVLHDTGNVQADADALAHAREHGKRKSWHYIVDEGTVIQQFDLGTAALHTNTDMDYDSVAVVVCINSKNQKAWAVAIDLVRRLRQQGIGLLGVQFHSDLDAGVSCPTGKNARMSFRQMITDACVSASYPHAVIAKLYGGNDDTMTQRIDRLITELTEIKKELAQ